MLILEQDENRILAELVLSLIIKLTHDYCMSLEQKAAEVSKIIIEMISVTRMLLIRDASVQSMNP